MAVARQMNASIRVGRSGRATYCCSRAAYRPANVGASVLVGECHAQLILSDKIMRLLVDGERRQALGSLHALRAPDVRAQTSRCLRLGQVDRCDTSHGESQCVVQLRVPPLEEQRRIVARWRSGSPRSTRSARDRARAAPLAVAAPRDPRACLPRRARPAGPVRRARRGPPRPHPRRAGRARRGRLEALAATRWLIDDLSVYRQAS